MADIAHLAGAAPANRALEALAGSDALFSRVGGLGGDPAALALAALPPLELGAPPAVGDAAHLPALGGTAVPGLTDVGDVSGLLGATAIGGGGTGLGAVGQTIETVTGTLGLGGSGSGQSALGAVGDVLTGGDPATAVPNAVEATVATVGHVGSGLTMAVDEIAQAPDRPLVDTLNSAILGFHDGVEVGAHTSGLNQTLHGVTDLGETVGLGQIGGDNLLTDVVGLPGAILSGDLPAALGEAANHAGAVVPAALDVVEGLGQDVQFALGSLSDGGSGSLLRDVAGVLGGGDPAAGASSAVANVGETVAAVGSGVVGAVGAAGTIGDAAPTDVLNDVVGEFHAGVEAGAHSSGLNHALHGVTNTGEAIGLGEIGGDNLVTDVAELPGAVLGGGDPTASVGSIVEHAGAAATEAQSIVSGLQLDLGVLTGGDALPTPGAGGADGLAGTIEDIAHGATGGGLPDLPGLPSGGDLDLGHLADIGGLTGVDCLPSGQPEHHGGLGLV